MYFERAGIKSLVLVHLTVICDLTSPERRKALGLHRPGGAVNNAAVWFVQDSLLEHLALVLDQKLDTLNGSGRCLGDSCCHSGQHEVLRESQFLSAAHFDLFAEELVLETREEKTG